jgi:hypothetical protein
MKYTESRYGVVCEQCNHKIDLTDEWVMRVGETSAPEGEEPVDAAVYESAVRGRADFRSAYREARAEIAVLNGHIKAYKNAAMETEAEIASLRAPAAPAVEVEFDRDAELRDFEDWYHAKSRFTINDLTYNVGVHTWMEARKRCATFKPAPARVEATDEAIDQFCEEYFGETAFKDMDRRTYIRAALSHFNQPSDPERERLRDKVIESAGVCRDTIETPGLTGFPWRPLLQDYDALAAYESGAK